MPTPRFAVGPVVFQRRDRDVSTIANAITFLFENRSDVGVWGSADALDQLITTNHATMALLSTGFPADSPALQAALNYLARLDTDKHVSFFWRAGTLLNIDTYVETVIHDMEYVWSYRHRIGVHKDYPVPFFLLKLMRFIEPKPNLTFGLEDVVDWVLGEWSEEECWYGRTSITSMALALLYDLTFPNKDAIVSRSREFLESSFQVTEDGGHFSKNMLEDAFTIFNLCETEILSDSQFTELGGMVAKSVRRLVEQSIDDTYWRSPPPFGGNIGATIYPTAVVVRALMAHHVRREPLFVAQVGSELAHRSLTSRPTADSTVASYRPFWGNPTAPELQAFCFVLMPFSPRKLTDIYERYVKQPIESQLGLKCIRADNIDRSTEIMKDIWDSINHATIVVAELTDRNPNVFYEMGMAHVVGKPVILIAQTIEHVPFDLRGVRVIIYDDGPAGYDYLASTIVRYAQSELSGQQSRD